MLGSYYANNPPSSRPKKILIISTLLVLGLIGTYAYLSRPPSPFLSLYEAQELEFQSFISYYNKEYSSDEYFDRLRIFLDNLAFIRVFNSQGHSFIMGVGPFADQTFEEFKAKKSFQRPPRDESELPTASDITLNAPAQVDWRTKGAVTPVKDQGDCGSCWSFSATGSMEGAWFLAGHPLVSLSEQQLMDCSWKYGNEGCNGGQYEQAIQYVIANKGITSETNYPYLTRDGVCNKSKASQIVATMSSLTKVAVDNPTALQNSVAQQPTSVSVDAGAFAWQHYTSGTITSLCGTNLDHDVLVVGYDTTASTPYWIVKNSWGTDWGMSGYLQIEISSGKGLCGINMNPGYPTS